MTQELINKKWVLDEEIGCITDNAEPVLEASFSDEKCKVALVLASHAPEMLERLKRFVDSFECDYVLDGEIVDDPYEWLIEQYKQTKELITKATTV